MSRAPISSDERLPLLTPGDLEQPPGPGDLSEAAAILTDAGREPDNTAQLAIALYRRKEIGRLIGNRAFGSAELPERIEALAERLPAEIQESDLLVRLVEDLAAAHQALKTNGKWRLPDVFGRRAARLAEEAKETKYREDQIRLEQLREKAALRGSLEITELALNDQLVFSSLYSKPGTLEGYAELRAKVNGFEATEHGTAVVLEIQQEIRSQMGGAFDDYQRQKGAIVRIVGTWPDNVMAEAQPSTIVKGEVLQFVTKDGEAFTHGALKPSSTEVGGHPLTLTQLAINGGNIFL